MSQFCIMQIKGEIKSIHVDQIRLITDAKKQAIDIFYTESKKFDVEKLFERQAVIFDVTLQSIDYYHLKLAKLWLNEILMPARSPNSSSKRKKGEGTGNWAQSMLNKNLEDSL